MIPQGRHTHWIPNRKMEDLHNVNLNHTARKCWKCEKEVCRGRIRKDQSTNACGSCGSKECKGKDSRHPSYPSEFLEGSECWKINLVSGFSQFSQFLRFLETWTPGKGIYTTISKGSSQRVTYLGLTWRDPAGRFPKTQTWVSTFQGFFSVFLGFLQFSWLRNCWTPNCIIADASYVDFPFFCWVSSVYVCPEVSFPLGNTLKQKIDITEHCLVLISRMTAN